MPYCLYEDEGKGMGAHPASILAVLGSLISWQTVHDHTMVDHPAIDSDLASRTAQLVDYALQSLNLAKRT